MSNIIPTGISAIQWTNNGVHIRVYFQHTDGWVYEAAYDDPRGWTPQAETVKLFQAKQRTPLAAVVWDTQASHPPQIRVYYIDDQNAIREHVYSGGWENGATLPSSNVSPISNLGATSWTDDPEIRVYYQQGDNTIQEIVWSGNWGVGHHFSEIAIPGSAIGATVLDAAPTLRVYYQAYDLSLHEQAWGGSWSDRKLNVTPVPQGGIAPVGWFDTNNDAHIRIYLPLFTGVADDIKELSYNGDSDWVYPPGNPTQTAIRNNSPISAIQWNRDLRSVQLRVYTQASTGDKIQELVYDGNTAGWSAQTLPF